MNRPNILIMYTDQQRWDALGCVNPLVKTPNLDALAAGGALMQNAFCNSPVCMPSRQSMLSGQYPSAIGCSHNGIEMNPNCLTIQQVLRTYGYHTANIGKLHFLNHAHRDHREMHPAYGFDTCVISDEPGCYEDAYIQWVRTKDPSAVDKCRCSSPPAVRKDPLVLQPRDELSPYVFEGPEELTHTAFVAEQTAEFIRTRDGQPFFCIAGFYAPHSPINPPKRFVDMYDQADMPLPRMNEQERTRSRASDDQWRKIKQYYYALCSHVDDQIGRILTALEQTGRADSTLLIFLSDHGEHLGDHNRTAKGPPGQDSCAHVPLIVSGTGIAAGQRPTQLVECVDLAPTIFDYCGFQTPPIMQGRSFLPLLTGGHYVERDSVFIEWRRPFERSVKTVRTHTLFYSRDDSRNEILYDLQADPHQLHNVAGDEAYRDQLHQMREVMLQRWFDVESQYPLRTGEY